ncbi:MAG: ABC transporter ATP-binding protein/permease [Propionibacteriales bacterium]|nr:ABC transporter ATP-binding protein/permease [Propionibacteriales bacterium]
MPAAATGDLAELAGVRAGSRGTARALPVALALAAAVGLGVPLGQIANAAGQLLSLRLQEHYRAVVLDAAAGCAPGDLADPVTVAELQAGYEAADAVDKVPVEAVKLLTGVSTACLLAGTIMTQNLAAGILILLTMLPIMIAFSVVAAAERGGWPTVARENRRASYLREFLLQQRPATELATMGASAQMAGLTAVRRRRAAMILGGLIKTAMRAEVLAGAVIAALFGSALLVLLTSGAGAAVTAAAVVGVIAGLHAVRSTGYAFGVLMIAVPRADAVDKVRGWIDGTTSAAQGDDASSRTVDQLDVSGLSVAYGQNLVVTDVSFSARRGELIALVGANGAGKTTTINALLGLVEPSAGRVLIDGRPADGRGSRSRRRDTFGLLTQEFGRYELTIRQNLLLGTTGSRTDDQMWAALRAAGVAAAVADMPDGLDQQLGPQWGGVGLSGGQWQRLALARVHLRNPGIWVLDEPTSSVDAETEELIFDELHRNRANRITIVVSHRAWTLSAMDRIHVFDSGRIVESGTYRELLGAGERFSELFASQLR